MDFINGEFSSSVFEPHGSHARFIQRVYDCWGKVPWHPLLFKDKNAVLDLEMCMCADHPAGAPRNRSICNPIPLGNLPDRFL